MSLLNKTYAYFGGLSYTFPGVQLTLQCLTIDIAGNPVPPPPADPYGLVYVQLGYLDDSVTIQAKALAAILLEFGTPTANIVLMGLL